MAAIPTLAPDAGPRHWPPDAGPRRWPPTLAEADRRRPSRGRATLVGERTRSVDRMKGALARWGIRGFTAALRKAPERLFDPARARRPPRGAQYARRAAPRQAGSVSRLDRPAPGAAADKRRAGRHGR